MKRLLAELGESLRMALGALATHKLRSALTLLRVLVGVFFPSFRRFTSEHDCLRS